MYKRISMKKPHVFIEHGQGPLINAKKALLSIGEDFFKGKTILVKPNIGRLTSPGTGVNTHPDAVAGVVEALTEMGARSISIGESPIVGVNTMEAFRKSGIDRVAEKYGCKLIDFDQIEPRDVDIPHGMILKKTKLTTALEEHDILLSLPVAKCHMHTGVTLGLKNMKGCLYRREKIRYHQLEYEKGREREEKTLDTAISDLISILKPHVTVIDGYVGMEGLGPSGGDTVKADFALASTDAIAADIMGVVLMGKDPAQIPHLKLVCERQGRPLSTDDISVSPADYTSIVTEFRDPPRDISLEYPEVQLCDVDSCSACLSTVMFFLKRFGADMSQYIPENEKLCLAIGKGIKDIEIPPGTVLVGNCAKRTDGDHTFVKGCPPVASRIYEAITGKEPPQNEPDVEEK